MAASQDYLAKLKELAQAKYDADVSVAEGEFKRKAGGTVSGTGPQTTYKSPAQVAAGGGTPQYGELDIAYERNREGLEGGLESRGLLRSGQAATSRGRMASDYQQSVLDYYNAMTQKKGALGAQLAFDLADLEAKYGNQTQVVAPVKSPPVTGDTKTPSSSDKPATPSSSDKPASQMTPEESFAFVALGQPANRQAATGVTSTPLPAPATTNQYIAAANMALGMPNALQVAAKPPASAKPAAPKPSPPPPPPKPAPKPALVPVKKPTPVKIR